MTKGVKFWQKSIETVGLLDGRPRKEVQETEKEKKKRKCRIMLDSRVVRAKRGLTRKHAT